MAPSPTPADDALSIYSNITIVQVFDPELDLGPAADEKLEGDPFLVRFSPDDPNNPKSWSHLRRWLLTLAGGLLVLSATFSSSAAAPIVQVLQEDFGFGLEVGTLTISIFLCGYCVGPLLWGPLSEQYGRRPIFIVAFFGYLCFQIGCALAKNTASILVFRFFGGTFAAAPLANTGAMISDIWGPKERGTALAIYAVAPFIGPSIGPIVGGFIYQANVSWRWLFWILAIFAGLCFLLIVFAIPETFEPVLLVKLAQEKRKSTGDERYYAALERRSTKLADRLEAILARPFRILFSEPILLSLTLYTSFIYGCIYMLFEAYPIVYTSGHGLSVGLTGLVYLPLPIGSSIAVMVYVLYINKDYSRKVEEYAPDPVPPEYRLRIAMIAAPIFAISFFWFAWTSYPTITIWAPIISTLFFGFSLCWLFLALTNYIIDVYLFVSASALAANVVVRSAFGAGFPLFAYQMYTKLGAEWASTLIGFVALAMVPLPFIFTKYGPAIRARSKFAPPRPSLKAAA